MTAGDASLTYGELDERSNAVAAALVAAGVGPGHLVGVATARSVDLVASILGILKLGAAYLPLDVTNPVDRLAYIVDDAGVRVVLTDGSLAGHALWSHIRAVTVLDVEQTARANGGAVFTPVPVPPAARAYVIYTSGSTGRPKGVEVTHGDVGALLGATASDFDFRPDDVWTLFHSYAFDFSVWELWGPLSSGARVVVVDRDLARDIDAFVGLLEQEGVTFLNLTPSAFYQFIDARRRRSDARLALRYIVFGGEELAFEQVRRWFDENPEDQAELVNMYGITETTVHVSHRPIRRADVSAADPSFIGRPLSSLAIHILDDRLRPVPGGVVGEMYVAGAQLAQGYLDRPELTATRFVADPFGRSGGRLYRTGDLARRSGGDIEYLGRVDGQIQLRGFRIEYGEVEEALLGVDGVVGAAARVIDDDHRGDLLIGYVVADHGTTVEPQLTRDRVGERVPRYMVPDLVMVIDRLPLTANGKLDRAALPLPVFETAEYVAPASAAEEAVAAVFADVLGVENVSVLESFFDAGGNSLSAMRLVARTAEALDAEVSVRDVFDAPTVRDLVLAVAGRSPALPPVTAVVPRPHRIPLSSAQQRMWLLNQLDVTSATYNIPMGVRLGGDVDIVALTGAIHDAIARHEVLRTMYPGHDASAVSQRVVPVAEALALFDWAEVESTADLIAVTAAGFDVTRELPIRGRIRRAEDGTVELALVVHHIAFDGESTPVLLRDVLAAYAHRLDGSVPPLPPLSVQYVDYALWQERTLGDVGDPDSPLGRQMAYWRSRLRELPVVTDLPMDRPRPAVFDSRGDVVALTVDDALSARIDELCRRYQLTPFMVSYSALAVAISRLAATADTVVASPTAGRTGSAKLDELVGMFVNTLVLRTDTTPGKSVDELLREIRDDVLDAFDNAQVQFDDLLEELAPPRSSSYSPLAQIAFTYTDGAPSEDSAPVAGLTAEPIAADGHEAKFDLTVLARGRTATSPMSVDFLYSTALFDASTVEGFAHTYRRALEAIVTGQDIAIGDIDIVGDSPATDTSSISHTAVSQTAVSQTEVSQTAISRPVVRGGSAEPDTLLDLLDRRDLDPDHPALICDGVELTYVEFEARTDRVARALLRAGVAPDDVVAIAMERSIEAVIAVVGVMKSGAAYLPVDVGYPADRVAYMLTDSHARFGITASDDDSARGGACEWFDLRELEASSTPDGPIVDEDRNGSVRLTNLAYLIYTSGSTGRPKAVAVNNTGMVDLAAALAGISGSREDNPDVRILHVASPSFDASVLEILWAVTTGHTLVIASPSRYAGDALGEILVRDEVTDVIITPSGLASLDPAFGETVRNLATGGEASSPQLVERWAARGRRLFNFYGPSETTIWATKARVMPGKPITIGRAIGGFTARVLDSRLHQVPRGVTGELYLSTRGVARGYLGKPGLTATAFVADPFADEPGSRMYATGDLVRLTASGDLEFAGRADHQVKINGQRVELGEIEAVLAEQPGVAQAVVLGHRGEDSPGRERLIGYLVAPRGDVDPEAILTHAKSRLAAHMVPAQLLVIRELPLTPGGKLDRDELPTPTPLTSGDFAAPATADEETLATIVAGLLGLERVSVTDQFFALGGDSIMSIQLASAAKAAGLVLSPREIFEHQTVRAMARAAGTGAARLPLVDEPVGGGRGEIALPPMVTWMVDGAQQPEDFADFNQSAVLFLSLIHI